MNFEQLYESKKGTLEDALTYIRSHDNVCLAGDCNEPLVFARNLHKIAPRVVDVSVIKARTGNYDFVKSEGMNGHINTGGFFYGPGWGEGHQKLNTSLIVTDLPDYANFVADHKPCNVFVASVTPMDEKGNFQIGLCMMWEPETYASVLKQPNHRVILEVNPNQVRVKGGLEINIADVTALYEVDEPLPLIPAMAASDIEDTIGGNVAELVHDGDTIQLGIGSLPDAVAHHLMDKHDLGLHTEMFTSSMGEMIRKGIITGERKNYYKGVHVGSFAGGDRALYETMRDTPTLRIAPASYAVNPMIIMQNDNMVSINTILEMDLTGQVCSESIGPRQFSGSGGGFCFAYGALHSKGGRGILAFQSRSKKGVPKIKPILTPGAVVTIPRNYVDYIVTEYGVAHLRGCSVKERCEQLIAIAHPDDREELRKQAQELFYL
ncbi:MAG: 4-hydroxybutyrate--acetyl-CoA CoA transferase [Oscillospiraceae bacterium]|nr:4-hydroxybutyrate--acetyl-CoA CoA transferase [Oscillospiraceae bacterium]